MNLRRIYPKKEIINATEHLISTPSESQKLYLVTMKNESLCGKL